MCFVYPVFFLLFFVGWINALYVLSCVDLMFCCCFVVVDEDKEEEDLKLFSLSQYPFNVKKKKKKKFNIIKLTYNPISFIKYNPKIIEKEKLYNL